MLEELKIKVCNANLLLPKYGLVTFTWGNVSEVDKKSNLIVIKPSGVNYEDMKPEDMVVVDFSGNVVEGKLKPSSDTPTHLELYRQYPEIGGIVHTHSRWATIFAQNTLDVPAFGTTHADYFYGQIPCTRSLTTEEIKIDYELNTGKVIAETFSNRNIEIMSVPAVVVGSHGPFSWGKDATDAVHNAVVLEEVSFMAWHNIMMNKDIKSIPQDLLDKHYNRKHGKNAYYGQ